MSAAVSFEIKIEEVNVRQHTFIPIITSHVAINDLLIALPSVLVVELKSNTTARAQNWQQSIALPSFIQARAHNAQALARITHTHHTTPHTRYNYYHHYFLTVSILKSVEPLGSSVGNLDAEHTRAWVHVRQSKAQVER